jgi:hypothetical protein
MSETSKTAASLDNMLLPEILRKISNQVGTTNKRRLLLQLKDSIHAPSLLTIFLLIYDWSIEFRVPDGIPPGLKLNRVPAGTDHTILRNEYKKLYNILVGGNPGLSDKKVMDLYVDILENLQHTEAELLLRIVNKCCFKVYGDDKKYSIPFKLIQEVYEKEVTWFNRGNGKEPVKYNPFANSTGLDSTVQEDDNIDDD